MIPAKILNFNFFRDEVSMRVNQFKNGVSSNLMTCIGVEKFGVKVSFKGTSNFGSNRPELFLREKKMIKVITNCKVFYMVVRGIGVELKGEESFLSREYSLGKVTESQIVPRLESIFEFFEFSEERRGGVMRV